MRSTVISCLLVALSAHAAVAQANCRQYTQRLSYTGKLNVAESRTVAEWHSPCDGALNASAASGRLTLFGQSGGAWRIVKQGISTIVPTLPAGTYRLVVDNPYGIPSNYAVSLKYGLR